MVGNPGVYGQRRFERLDYAEGVSRAEIATTAISTNQLKDEAVTAAKLATTAVTTEKIKDENVTTAKIATTAIQTDRIKDGAVTEAKCSTTPKVRQISIQADSVTVNPIFTTATTIVCTRLDALLIAGSGASVGSPAVFTGDIQATVLGGGAFDTYMTATASCTTAYTNQAAAATAATTIGPNKMVAFHVDSATTYTSFRGLSLQYYVDPTQ